MTDDERFERIKERGAQGGPIFVNRDFGLLIRYAEAQRARADRLAAAGQKAARCLKQIARHREDELCWRCGCELDDAIAALAAPAGDEEARR